MSNATAAGPSYGILDVLFGKAPKEAEQADGQEFGGLMELIKALNKKEKDEDGNPLDGNRTDQEMANGKGAMDYRAAGIPGLVSNATLLQIPVVDPKSGEQSQVIMGTKSALKQNQLMSSMEPIDLAEVNQLLKEKSLSALSAEEAKLLGDVNGKLATLAAENADSPKAAQLQALDAKLQKELEQRGIANANISSVETEGKGAAPEIMSTETYLSMHNNAKHAAKDGNKLEASEAKGQAPNISLLNAAREQNPGEAENSGKDSLQRGADQDDKSAKAPGKRLNSDAAAFADALGQSVKGSGVAKKDVYLNSAKPEDMKQTLVGEVVQNVNANAVKGGGEMRLVIHPEELGEVKIKVGSKEGKIEVHISAKNEEVASMIRSGSKDLESSLGNQNLSLARFEVTVSDSAVVSTDTKSSLADQFLSQQQSSSHQGNMQSNSSMADDRGFARWDSQSQRQGTAELLGDDLGRSKTKSTPARGKQNYAQRSSSQRLDVVA